MDAQKRQKVILVAVSVLALGAGSYWFLGRDSDEGTSAGISEGTVQRKEKKVQAEPTAKGKKVTKAVTRVDPTTVERKERTVQDETTVERKKKREEKTKEKKKTIAPAA